MLMGRYHAANQWARLPLVAAALVLLAADGCGSSANSAGGDEKSLMSSGPSNSGIDMNCIGDHVEHPPESFHYSFKSSDGQYTVDKEADITPQRMDITIQENSGSHSYHGVRSDSDSWNSAVLDLSGLGFTSMAAMISFIKDSSSLKQTGTESVNGYSATRYSIDTAGANSSDRKTFGTMFGPGTYEKGDIWVAAQGCPVKLLLDEGRQQANGTVKKLHYELALVKK